MKDWARAACDFRTGVVPCTVRLEDSGYTACVSRATSADPMYEVYSGYSRHKSGPIA